MDLIGARRIELIELIFQNSMMVVLCEGTNEREYCDTEYYTVQSTKLNLLITGSSG